MQLKTYQQRSLDVLGKYFQNCKQMGNANLAFYATTLDVLGEGINYHEVDELPGLPYVCLRVPTGGGETLMAAHSVSVATRDFLGLDHSFVLWLTPSTTIRDQTLNALKDRKHPYRSALESTLRQYHRFGTQRSPVSATVHTQHRYCDLGQHHTSLPRGRNRTPQSV